MPFVRLPSLVHRPFDPLYIAVHHPAYPLVDCTLFHSESSRFYADSFTQACTGIIDPKV